MEREISIRKAVLDDYSDLARLTLQLGYQEEPAKVKDRLNDLLTNHDDHVIFVAEVDNQIVGWVHGFFYLLFYAETMCEIGGLVVDENYRRKGIAKKLMKSIEDWAVEKGCNKVSLRSGSDRKNAHQFYKDIGFDFIKTQYRFIKDIRTR